MVFIVHNSLYRLIQSLLLVGIASFSDAKADTTRPSKAIPVLMAEQKGEHGQDIPLSKNMIALFQHLETATKLKFEIRRYPWRRVLRNGENGEGLIFAIYKTPEREKIFAFSEAVYSDKIWLVTRCEDRINFESLADLKGRTIGIVQGSSAGAEFDSQVNVLFKAEYNTSSLAARFSKLAQKRMDAFLLYEPRTDVKEIQGEINQLHAAEFEPFRKKKLDFFCIMPKPVSTTDAHFAIPLGADRSIIETIDQAVLRSRKSGELNRIFTR